MRILTVIRHLGTSKPVVSYSEPVRGDVDTQEAEFQHQATLTAREHVKEFKKKFVEFADPSNCQWYAYLTDTEGQTAPHGCRSIELPLA